MIMIEILTSMMTVKGTMIDDFNDDEIRSEHPLPKADRREQGRHLLIRN